MRTLVESLKYGASLLGIFKQTPKFWKYFKSPKSLLQEYEKLAIFGNVKARRGAELKAGNGLAALILITEHPNIMGGVGMQRKLCGYPRNYRLQAYQWINVRSFSDICRCARLSMKGPQRCGNESSGLL